MLIKAKPIDETFDAFLYENVKEVGELLSFVIGASTQPYDVQDDGTVILKKGTDCELTVRFGDVVYFNEDLDTWDVDPKHVFEQSYSWKVPNAIPLQVASMPEW